MPVKLALDVTGRPVEVLRPLAGISQNVTTSGVSAEAAAFDADSNVIRIIATADCYVRLSPTGGAAVVGDMYVVAGVPEYIRIDLEAVAGPDRLQAIQVTAGGLLNIQEFE